MADNAVNAIANNMAAMQMNPNMPANLMPAPLPPGAVYPYILPQDDNVEEPFDPISSYAIMESGQFGPLSEEELKDFLRRKLDRRVINSKDVVQHYTTNIPAFNYQLIHLRNRINQIKTEEKDRTDFLKKRIRDFERALRESKPLPFSVPQLRLSKAATEAFRYVGSQGPLNEDQLLQFIHTAVMPQIPANELIKQLQALRLRINDNVDIEKHKLKLPYERVLKALQDILLEIMSELPRSTRTLNAP